MKETDIKNDKEIDIDYIYTPIERVLGEIIKRKHDSVLQNKIRDFWKNKEPFIDLFDDKNRAVISRDIITADREFFKFLELVKSISLTPLFWEYNEDKFVSKNSDKYYLSNLLFISEEHKNNKSLYFTKKIVNFNKYEGKCFSEIRTDYGMSITDFHHNLLSNISSINIKDISNFSLWFKNHRSPNDNEYYLNYLAMFMSNVILFDNFLVNKDEFEFTTNKLLPSYKRIVETFGVKPLIVRVAPKNEETNMYWWSFGENAKNYVEILTNSSVAAKSD